VKIILKNNDNLRFIEIYLFKNEKYLSKLDHISNHELVDKISNIDDDIDYIIVEVPRGIARLTIVDSLARKSNNHEYFLYSSDVTIGISQLTIARKPNGNPINCITHAKDSDVKIMKRLLNLCNQPCHNQKKY
jgi:hypothetical protein